MTLPRNPPLDSYPPLPYRGEDMRIALRVEPCACGELLSLYCGQDTRTMLDTHYQTDTHMRYRLTTENDNE